VDPLLFRDLWERLRAFDLRCEYVDGRPAPGEAKPDGVGVMLTAITQLRRAVRSSPPAGVVVVLPHLDVMATSDGGWTNISREVVPLLYEEPGVLLHGFRDPTLPLLPVVEKLFLGRYTVRRPFRGPESGPVPAPDPLPREPTAVVSPEDGPSAAADPAPDVASPDA
jgi:cell division protease FtsH